MLLRLQFRWIRLGILLGVLALCTVPLVARSQDEKMQPYEVDILSYLAGRFTPLEWKSNSSLDSRTYKYRLFIPKPDAQNRLQPLLLWLHGQGESGTDNEKNLRWLQMCFRSPADSPPLFILVPQRPGELPWIGPEGQEDVATVAYNILQDLLTKYPIDPDRIYLAGACIGGSTCWELARRHPDKFAALVPCASSISDVDVTSLLKIPIWVFHTSTDKAPLPDSAMALVAAIQKAGGIAEFTLTDPKTTGTWRDHDCWTAAFQDYHVLDWMLTQRRGAPRAQPPGASVWTSFEIWVRHFGWVGFVWIAFVALVGSGWVWQRKSRQFSTTMK
jgi:predicted peptidase